MISTKDLLGQVFLFLYVSYRSSYLMATESPLLGQLRHIPSSPIISSGSSTEPHPHLSAGADPLQGLVQEMALSAVMQKHGSSAPSSASSSHSNGNGAIIKNYNLIPAQAGATTTPSPAELAVAVSAPQQQGMVLSSAGGNVQQGFISSMSLLAHPSQAHTNPVIQGTSLSQLGQLQEVNSPAPTSMVQLTPVCCYEGAGSAQPSPVVERSALLQPNM